MMEYKISKDSVQETLIIPLYGRKVAMDLYPDLFSDKERLKNMLKTWLKPAEMESVGLYFSVEDENDLMSWSNGFASVTRKGYMAGYRPLDKRYGLVANTIFKFGDKSNMCQVIEISFKR